MASSYEAVKENSRAEWLVEWAGWIIRIERALPMARRLEFYEQLKKVEIETEDDSVLVGANRAKYEHGDGEDDEEHCAQGGKWPAARMWVDILVIWKF